MDGSACAGLEIFCPFLPEDFPDLRLYHRARRSMRAIADGRLHHTSETPALRRGKHRFCHNERTDGEQLLEGSARSLPEPLRQAPVLLSCEDTTMGRVGRDVLPADAGALRHATDRGHVIHAAFGLRPGDPTAEAWLGALVWTRSTQLHLQDHKSRAPEERESLKWFQLRRDVHGRLRRAGFTGRIVSINDREGDNWTSLFYARKRNHELITRFTHNHIIEEDDNLKLYLKRQPLTAVFEMDVYGSGKRRHRPRKAKVELRWAEVTMWPSKACSAEQFEPITVVGLHLIERRPPRRHKRFESFLLTTCPVETDEQAMDVVYWYGHRWGGSEVPFDILKNGLDLEGARVKNVEATRKLVALEGPVAAQVAQWVAASREKRPPPVSTYFDRETLRELGQACKFWRVPVSKGWTIPKVIEALARLAGADYRPNRPPGWRVVLRGWRRFEEFRQIRAFLRDGEPREPPPRLRLDVEDDEPDEQDDPRPGAVRSWKIMR